MAREGTMEDDNLKKARDFVEGRIKMEIESIQKEIGPYITQMEICKKEIAKRQLLVTVWTSYLKTNEKEKLPEYNDLCRYHRNSPFKEGGPLNLQPCKDINCDKTHYNAEGKLLVVVQ